MRWILEPRGEVGREKYPFCFVLDSSSLGPLPGIVTARRQELKDRRKLAHETAEWCRVRYGTDDGKAARLHNLWRWTQDGTSFRFRFETDAFEFKMRWG